MKRLFALALAFNCAAGCQPASTSVPPAVPSDKSDVHVRTPRIGVDVEHKPGGGTDVDVSRKSR